MPRPFHPTDLFKIRETADVVSHPTNGSVAFVQKWLDADKDANCRRIYLWQVGQARALTSGTKEHTPRFSPDGRYLAFMAEKTPQVHVLDLSGGAAIAVTEFKDGASEFTWLPDSSGFVVSATVRPDDQENADDDELARRPRRITNANYRFNGQGWVHDRSAQLFTVALPTSDAEPAEPTQITSGDHSPAGATISPDGNQVAYIARTGENHDLTSGFQIITIDIAGGEPTVVTEEMGFWDQVAYTPDGQSLLALGFSGAFRAGVTKLYRIDFDGTTTCIDPDDVSRIDAYGVSAPIQIVNNEVYLPALRRGAVHVDAINLATGESRTALGGNRSISAFSVASDGRIHHSSGDETHPMELCTQTPDGSDETQLTDLNADFLEEVELVDPEVVQIESTGGAVVEAWLTRPPDCLELTGEIPALIYVHGGPMTQWGYRFFDEFQVAAAQGYVVIGGNPRGADGYGTEWAAAIEGCIGTHDWDDVQAITAHLAGLDEVDENKIGIGGGSYGGFMTTWAIGHSDVYAAALSERAVNNWESMQGSSDIGPWFCTVYTGATNAEDIELVRKFSPITYADAITTPTLIIHSEEDFRCPIEQAEQLFVALRMNDTPVELVRFPGENHELSRGGLPSHRMERFTYIHEWYAKYLGGEVIADLNEDENDADDN